MCCRNASGRPTGWSRTSWASVAAAVLERYELAPSGLAGLLEALEVAVDAGGEDGGQSRKAFAYFGFGQLTADTPDSVVPVVRIDGRITEREQCGYGFVHVLDGQYYDVVPLELVPAVVERGVAFERTRQHDPQGSAGLLVDDDSGEEPARLGDARKEPTVSEFTGVTEYHPVVVECGLAQLTSPRFVDHAEESSCRVNTANIA